MIHIHEFKDIAPFIRGVQTREYGLLIWQSRGGLGKTYTIKDVLDKDDYMLVSGHVTAMKLYYMVWKNPEKIIVFDDVHALLRDKKIVALMLQICDMGEDKTVGYSTTATYHGEKLPRTVISNNKSIILCNNIPIGDATYDALLSRAVHINFNPSNKEVLNTLKGFAEDKEIYSWLNNNVAEFQEPLNFRMYEWAVKFKACRQDWRHLISQMYALNDEFKLVGELVNMPYAQAVKRWNKETGKSRRTYDRRKKEYEQSRK